MRSIIEYFIKNEIAGNLIMVALIIFGFLGLKNLNTTYFPERESRNITVRIVYPGSSPEEIEEGIVTKIEENLKGVSGIDRVTSVSSENSGSVNIEVLKGYETDLVLDDIKNAIARINSFPIDMEPIVAFKQENLGRAIDFALTGNVDLKTLKGYARQVESELLATPGISKVEISGFPEEEIEIAFRETDLRKYNLTFQEAANAIRNYNLELTGGTLKAEKEELLIRADNKKYNANELHEIIVKSNTEGGIVRLYQVADIVDKWADVPARSYLNGKPAVIIKVQNTLEEDMLTITEQMREYIDKFNLKTTDVEAVIIIDSSVTLNQRIDLLKENGLIGSFLVLLFLAMFLNYRLAFWVALSIPISFAGMFIAASAIGITINVISLFGMIVVIGILVDDGIVIAENIYQKYESGYPPYKAALEGSMEVIPAVISAVLTTVVAFSAFFFLDGRIGDIFREMAIVVIFSLLFSLVEGIFILPAHIAHSKAMSKGGDKNKFNRKLDDLLIKFKKTFYLPVLHKAIRYPIPAVMTTVVLLFIVIGAFRGGLIKGTFFPNLPRDNFFIDLQLPSGTRESITKSLADSIERVAIRVNDQFSKDVYGGENKPIIKMQKNIGPASNIAKLDMTLLDGEARGDLGAREIMNKIREELGPILEAESLTFYSGSPFGKPLSISLLSADKKELNEAIIAVKAGLAKIPELKDIVDNNKEGLKEVQINLKPEAYNLGFTLRDIVSQVRQGFFGGEVQRLQRGKDEVKVWVRYSEEDRSNLSKLEDMRIRSPSGQTIPLSQLATFEIARGIININHIDGQREARIEADLASDNSSVSDITSDIKSSLLPEILKDFPNVNVGFEGQDREQAKTAASFKKVMPLIFLIMFFIVVLTFNSVSQTLILFSLIPFGFIGVAMGHYLVGLPISFFSVLGVIALIGVMINDGLVFITAFNEKIKAGMPFDEAVIDSGSTRFRPILLTSITTIAGLAPLVLEKSLQAQFLIPMAVSVASGLVISTFLMLLFLPSMLVLINRIKRHAIGYWEGRVFSKEEVEPAYALRVQNVSIYLIGALIALVLLGGIIFAAIKITSIVS